MSRQTKRAQAIKEAKRVAPERGLNPSGVRPTRFFGQTPMNPVGFLQTRANIRKNWYDTKAQMRRLGRHTEYRKQADGTFDMDKDGNRFPVRVLHETKGWMSARIAA